jgi:hypothetical protein
MGPGKYENVGKSQPVLIMINPIILTRTRMLGAVLCCAVCLCQGDFGPLLEAVAVARVQAGTGVTPPGAVPPCIVDDEHDDETAAEIDHHQRQLHGPTVVSVVSGSEPFPIYIYIYIYVLRGMACCAPPSSSLGSVRSLHFRSANATGSERQSSLQQMSDIILTYPVADERWPEPPTPGWLRERLETAPARPGALLGEERLPVAVPDVVLGTGRVIAQNMVRYVWTRHSFCVRPLIVVDLCPSALR